MISVVDAPSTNGRLTTRPPAASTSSRPWIWSRARARSAVQSSVRIIP